VGRRECASGEEREKHLGIKRGTQQDRTETTETTGGRLASNAIDRQFRNCQCGLYQCHTYIHTYIHTYLGRYLPGYICRLDSMSVCLSCLPACLPALHAYLMYNDLLTLGQARRFLRAPLYLCTAYVV
jgi:hypothetical protein